MKISQSMTLMDIPFKPIFVQLIRQLSKLFALSLFSILQPFIAFAQLAIMIEWHVSRQEKEKSKTKKRTQCRPLSGVIVEN